MIFLTIMFLIGILGFMLNRKIGVMFNLVIATIALFLFIYEEPFFILSTILDKTFLVEFHEIDSTTLMALSPYFVTGFSDAESCFNVSVSKRIKSTVGYVVQARFVIELQLSDIDLLFKIQSFFKGIGTVTKDPVKNVCRFSVVSIKDINNLIILWFAQGMQQSCMPWVNQNSFYRIPFTKC